MSIRTSQKSKTIKNLQYNYKNPTKNTQILIVR